MHVRFIIISLVFLLSLVRVQCYGQQPDSAIVRQGIPEDSTVQEKNPLAMDTHTNKEFNPHTATIRSALIPGWGQAYNKKYWKIPIVYGALGVSAGVFFYNLKTYKQLRQAVIYRRDTSIHNPDSLIAPDLRPLSTESLTFYRNAYRQNIDYSVLAFLLLWGLNVVDATVDAHLKAFNVTPDLTLKIRPQYKLQSNMVGLNLVFQLQKREYKFNLPH